MSENPLPKRKIEKAKDSLRKLKRNLTYGLDDLKRSISLNNTEIINQKEVRIAGLRRSGNHAVINWIWKQHPGEVLHLNKIRVKKNPYRFLYEHYPKERLRQEAAGDFTKKDCLLYSYEDYGLDQITHWRFEKKHDLYLGKTAKRYDLLLLRDPFNWLASRLKSNFMDVRSPDKNLIELWIEYAQEYLGETQYLTHNKIVVNYNEWFLNVDYRKQLADRLGLEFSDRGIDDVKTQGGGSSFDGLNFRGQGSQMDVLNRWEKFADNEQYRQLLDNEALWDYSERIFGKLPGTEMLK